CGQGTNVPLTF
nr:immunoglobulin light chain junction region [Macaca mulatta]MOW39477.1 immunoglobulin light chain junction region [Macaca mulatta]MOW39543.1 immunoglobulin light chain junction region [Macaca mulatta]MOW39876.1 immunoglobulin light chain junction region [Macaca mulatta]MOW40019.1 immunoglobulin light chain junction region [Macaca mulatta]